MTLNLLIAQMDSLVGDCEGNSTRIIALLEQAKQSYQAEMVIFPELALTGYPPEDLLLRDDFHDEIQEALTRIIKASQGLWVILGLPYKNPTGLYNSAAIIENGELKAMYHKHHLPNSSVFDEKRYFLPGDTLCLITVKGFEIGLLICEDLWNNALAKAYQQAGAQLLVSINASPFEKDKALLRSQLLKDRCQETGLPILYVNNVGGQDELLFDGGSCAIDTTGTLIYQDVFFQSQVTLLTLQSSTEGTLKLISKVKHLLPSSNELIYHALIRGMKDYVVNNGFSQVVLGLSGGIDSALVLCLAVAAFGKDNVEAILMPSQFTAQMSIHDAQTLADNLGVHYDTIPIDPIVKIYKNSLADKFKGLANDTTEENLQSRCRGTLLMAISNKQGKLLLTTGNKSELAVGYATLYGDMCGAFAPLKDVMKTKVYELARLINKYDEVIPQRIIDRPPSAELAPDQKDEDSLPPYSILDPILEQYLEQDASIKDLITAGFDEKIVRDIINKVEMSEYKRRQSPPGVRITKRAFGRDRRYPITTKFNKT